MFIESSRAFVHRFNREDFCYASPDLFVFLLAITSSFEEISFLQSRQLGIQSVVFIFSAGWNFLVVMIGEL